MAEVRESTEIADVFVVEPVVHGDARGVFVETYRREWFPLGREMVQGNRSNKQAGVVVGLHYHMHQADYWYVPIGRAQVVLFDLREGSPTQGNSMHIEIGEHNHFGVFIPPGIGHGFGALTDMTITYLVDQYYNDADELGVAWDDRQMALNWGVSDPVLSQRDKTNPKLSELSGHLLPRYRLRN